MLPTKTKNKRRRSGATTIATILDTPAKKAPDIVPMAATRVFNNTSVNAEDSIGTAMDKGIIEKGKRLSESMLWQLQRGYYDTAGSLAWKNNAKSLMLFLYDSI